ncbi:MAG: acyl-CoA dehydrogenase family protein [Sneathiella sp.]|nr:acyl-CoA dehydrogenase family protein [Sneathiella sp.]
MTASNPDLSEIYELAEDFAVAHIRPRRHELITATEFPKDLWQSFAASGLAGLSVPAEFGGLGADYRTLSQVASVLSRNGRVPGATMVFMSHWLISKLHIAGDAPDAIRQKLLPELAKGATTLSVAISEPGAGAHPKHLQTTARRDGDSFILNGEKAFLTNGPLADYFIVLAITDEAKGQKAFSAILVPADSDGFRRTDGVKIDFLHPCPHGGIALGDCRVPAVNLIGVEGDAFIRTSLRMRAIEDAAGAGGSIGSMYGLLSDIAGDASAEMATEIGAIATQLKTLDIIAVHLASMADGAGNDVQPLLELQLGFHQQTQASSKSFAGIMEKLPLAQNPEVEFLYRDISKSLTIAHSAHIARLTKIGQSVLLDPDSL